MTNLGEIEVLLLHNAPKKNELKIIDKNVNSFPQGIIKHIIIQERESLYRTWNRGIDMANGKYLTIWNVDDVRIENSLELQAQVLDRHPEAALTYGDQIEVTSYGDRKGKLYQHPEYQNRQNVFIRNFFGGCFLMWRKSIHDRIGYFDEQFKSGGDFDFWIRVVRNYSVKKTPTLLGYYLNEQQGLSTSSSVQPVENNVISLRYAQFDKLNFISVFKAIRYYNIYNLKWRDHFSPVENLFADYHIYFYLRIPLIIWGLIKYPFTFLLPNLFKAFIECLRFGPSYVLKRATRKTGIDWFKSSFPNRDR